MQNSCSTATLTADLSLVCFLTPFLRVSKHLLLSFTRGADFGDSKVAEASRALQMSHAFFSIK